MAKSLIFLNYGCLLHWNTSQWVPASWTLAIAIQQENLTHCTGGTGSSRHEEEWPQCPAFPAAAPHMARAGTTASLVEFQPLTTKKEQVPEEPIWISRILCFSLISISPPESLENASITDFKDCLFNANIVCFTEWWTFALRCVIGYIL